ncbi:MAG: hypothetical protein AB9897_01685 [Anaerolineaceae bacterium]
MKNPIEAFPEENKMRRNYVFQNIIRFCIDKIRSLIDYRNYMARQREKYIEINEIKDWSKGEGYFGNTRLF